MADHQRPAANGDPEGLLLPPGTHPTAPQPPAPQPTDTPRQRADSPAVGPGALGECIGVGPADDPAAPIGLDLRELVRQYSDLLYRYAFRLTGRGADAEDLTQQTFLIAHQKLHQVRDAAAAKGWLVAVMRHVYLRNQKKQRAEKLTTAPLSIDTLPAPADDDAAIDQEQLQQALNQLPDAYKLVLLSYYFEDLSYREIAERFALPVGTVMSRLSRAKDHLRAALAEDETPCPTPAERNAFAKAVNGTAAHSSVHE